MSEQIKEDSPQSTREYEPHQIRVIEERDQLSERLDKLISFMETTTFKDLSGPDKLLLREQAAYMNMYKKILNERIARF